MGNRKFYDQMLMDACQHHQLKITDEVDVTTMKEYMQVGQPRAYSACDCHVIVTYVQLTQVIAGFKSPAIADNYILNPEINFVGAVCLQR